VPLELGEPLDAPMIEHPVMEPVLVDRRQLVLELRVQVLDDLGIALHDVGFLASDDSRTGARRPASGILDATKRLPNGMRRS
jgi:hypothetical protein